MKIHFIGVGGIGVSALAKYYLEKGHEISGSDLVSSEITDALREKGVKILIGKHRVGNLPKSADLVVYSPAVPATNPEFKRAKKLKIKCQSYPEALGELTKEYFTVAVCGSHGKSTVAAMIGVLLTKAGLDPTVIVGTKVKEFAPHQKGDGGGSNCRVGKSKYLVIEADEYFASFLNYWPKIIVLTTLEPDHLDYYKNFKNYLKAFQKFISHLPKNGILVANKDDRNTYNTFSTAVKNVLWYSLKQKEAGKIRKILKVPGEHNVSNTLAVLAVARILKVPDKISFKVLSEYRGSWRRFDIVEAEIRGYQRGKTRKIIIINDYAHHPTQIKVTLKAAREKFPKKEIWCIFQPHQYQRTYYLWNDFVKVFKEAPVNKLILTDIYSVAGREKKEIKEKVNSKKLVKAVNRENVIFLQKQKIIDYLKKNLKGGEVVIIMGAGDIYDLANIL